MPFAGYEDFDECVRKNKDKEDPKAYCAEIKRKTEKSVQSVDVFEEGESKTPAIDKVVDKFAKGGPGSGQKGHRTEKQKYDDKRKKVIQAANLKQIKRDVDEILNTDDKYFDSLEEFDAVVSNLEDKAEMQGIKIPSKRVFNRQRDWVEEKIRERGMSISERLNERLQDETQGQKLSRELMRLPTSKTPVIDALIEKGGPGSGQKGHKTSDLRRHSQYTSSDYSALKKKGYTDKEISGIWDKDKKFGKKPLHRKEIPKMDESIKAKKISERLKSESTSKTPAIDALIAKGGPGSGVKGHTTARELAIKKKFEELDKARTKADALAEKDIRDGQRMIDKAAKESEAAFEETLRLGPEGNEAQFKKISEKRDKLKKQEQTGWDLRIKGQNRKAEISDKYSEAARKLMGIHSDSRTEVLTGRMGEGVTGVAGETVTGTMGEPSKKVPILRYEEGPHPGQVSDSNTATVDNIPSSILERSDKDSNDIIGISDEGEYFSMINGRLFTRDDAKDMIRYLDQSNKAHRQIPTGGIHLFREDIQALNQERRLSRVDIPKEWSTPLKKEKVQKPKTLTYEEANAKTKKINEKWYKLNDKQNKEAVAISEAKTPQEHKDRTQKYLKTKAEFDQTTKDLKAAQNERARIEISEEKMSDEVKLKGKEQPTLTRDAPKHTPKPNLLATKHAEAAVKRGTLFKELGKKSKKELKGIIQQDSKVDMAGSLKQMTKSDMKYHITSGKYPSPKGSEEAYNALTKQERKGLLKPIPDPKTPKAKGSEPSKRRNAPSIKAIQVEGVDAYQSTHGKKPRGTGLWMFQIGEDSGNTYSAETTFKEAQKQAKKQAQEEMKWSVKLLP